MALSGPDTGGSQWFITLATQPHLDGGYTVFGRLRGGDANAVKVVQGDQIRRIHR
jgi:cyclophilin family peptidyl-prolyl cis-trans isomerase